MGLGLLSLYTLYNLGLCHFTKGLPMAKTFARIFPMTPRNNLNDSFYVHYVGVTD